MTISRLSNERWGFSSNCFVCEPTNAIEMRLELGTAGLRRNLLRDLRDRLWFRAGELALFGQLLRLPFMEHVLLSDELFSVGGTPILACNLRPKPDSSCYPGIPILF